MAGPFRRRPCHTAKSRETRPRDECKVVGVRGPYPEGLPKRLSEVAVLVLVITLVVWLDLPKLLWPAFIVAVVLLSIDRWRRGIYPWPPRQRPR